MSTESRRNQPVPGMVEVLVGTTGSQSLGPMALGDALEQNETGNYVKILFRL
jgi:hypothetical protein